MDRSIPLTLAIQHRLAVLVRPVTENFSYTVKSGMAAGLRRRGGLGFLPKAATPEDLFWIGRASSLAGKVVYDIGSYEGIFSIFAASNVGVGHVVVVEPSPESYRRTTVNLAENAFTGRATVLNVGLGSKASELRLAYPKGEPARGSVDPLIIESMKREGVELTEHPIRICRLDDLIGEMTLPSPDVMKIDVEGHELEVLLGAEVTIRRAKPDVFLELHGVDRESQMAIQNAVHALLRSWGYKIWTLAGNEIFQPQVHVGHIFCSTTEGRARH